MVQSFTNNIYSYNNSYNGKFMGYCWWVVWSRAVAKISSWSEKKRFDF